MATLDLELVLANGQRRRLQLPSHTDSVANALDRLEAWVQTADGGWVQKSYIAEVRLLGSSESGSDGEPAKP
jgi:hypothetical protein